MSGGGIISNGTLTITNSQITGNSTGGLSGGGIFISGAQSGAGPTVIRGSEITNNTSEFNGGGISISTNAELTIIGSEIANNTATYDGGGMYNSGGSPTLTNVTVTGNTLSDESGIVAGIYVNQNSTLSLNNTIVFNNIKANGDTDNLYAPDSTMNISHSLLQGDPDNWEWGTDHTGNDGGGNVITGTSPFADEDNGDFGLAATSLAIDAGDNQAYIDAGGDPENDLDLAGNPRVIDTIIDMGAYEFQLLTLIMAQDDDFTATPIDGFHGGVTAGSVLDNDTLDGAPVGPGDVMLSSDSLPGGFVLNPDGSIAVPPGTPAGSYPFSYTICAAEEPASCDTAAVQLAVAPPAIVPGTGNVLYVDQSVDTGDPDYTGAGDSWQNALPELADALRWARVRHMAGDGWDENDPLRIFVAVGTYRPLYSAEDGQFNSDGGRDNTFVLVPNVQLYGGFDPENGITGLDDARVFPDPPLTRGSVLSGNLGDPGDDADNALHVLVTVEGVGDARLDGFAVTGGNADAGQDTIPVYGIVVGGNSGGGLWAQSSPLIANMIFADNRAGSGGGAAFRGFATPQLTNVAFIRNQVNFRGGGIVSVHHTAPILINTSFHDNSAGDNGGAMSLTDSSAATLVNAVVWGNANEIYASGLSTLIDHALIAGGCPANATCNDVLDTDPLFANAAGGDLRPLPGSPALFAGTGAPYQAGGPAESVTTDLAGNPRFVDAQIDLGAWQHPGFVLAATPEEQSAALGAAYAPITVTAGARADTGFADPGDYPLPCDDVTVAYPASGATVIFEGITDNPFTLQLDDDCQAVTPDPVAAGEIGEFRLEFDTFGIDPAEAQMRNLGLYAVTAAVAGGSGAITPAEQTVVEGEHAVFTVTPDAGYSAVIAGDCPAGDLKGEIYSTGPIVADCEVIANFTRNPPAGLVIDGGDGQSAAVNTAFAEPLAVRVHDDQGDPLPGIAVNFEVQASGGAGATLFAAQAETDDQGLAAVAATANGTAGDYTVTASVAGLEPVVFALTNTGLETTLELTASADTIDQGDTLILTASVAGAAARGSLIPTGTVGFRTGNRTLCDTVELVDGIAACEADDLPAGEHLIEANYGGDAAFAAASAAVTVTIEGEVPEAVVIPTTSRFGLLLLALMALMAGLRAIRAGG